MTSQEKSFETLLKEAPASSAAGTVSLVGTLAQSSEAKKFVLILQDGTALTLEIASVKSHAVLGSSVGQTIVRVDVDSTNVPAAASWGAAQQRKPLWGDKPPWTDKSPWWDRIPKNVLDPKAWSDPPWTLVEGPGFPNWGGVPVQAGGGLAPFALANPHQVLQGVRTSPYIDDPEYSGWRDKFPPNDFY